MKQVLLSEENHRALKCFAAERGETMNCAVAGLMRMAAGGKGNPRPSREYRVWLEELITYARAHGDEAAEQFMAENPFRSTEI